MGLDLEVLSTRRDVISPAEFARAWRQRYNSPAPKFRQLGTGEAPASTSPFALDGHYSMHFADGNGPGFDVSRNHPDEMDEQTYLEDFGDASHLVEIIDGWRRAGHTYGLTLNGQYGASDVQRFEHVAEVLGALAGGLIIALTPLPFGRGRGLYRPDGKKIDVPVLNE